MEEKVVIKGAAHDVFATRVQSRILMKIRIPKE